MEGQFLAELARLLEKRTAQHGLGGQTVPSSLLHPISAQVRCDQAEQGRMLIQPRRGLLQLAADLVLGEDIEEAGLDRAVLAHCRLCDDRLVWTPRPKVYLTPSAPACAKAP